MERRSSMAVELMAHALIATKPHNLAEAESCNAGVSRARDFLLHASARAVVAPGGPISAAEMDALRDPALRSLRLTCRTCGLCARLGLEPP